MAMATPTSGSQQSTPPSQSGMIASGSNSPTSPRQANAVLYSNAPRQLRPPKTPMYVPASLRPTERPAAGRQPIAPPTPPHSQFSSSDSLATTTNARPHSMSGSRPGTAGFTSALPPLDVSGSTDLSRSSTVSSASFTAPPSPSSAAFPQPTRVHWKPDALAPCCEASGCGLAFGLLARRHHCRRCGGVFCTAHSQSQVPLDAEANFDERGGWSRACAACGEVWAATVVARLEDSQSRISAQQKRRAAGALPVGGAKGAAATTKGADGGATGVTIGSVPKDWSWSTF